MEDDLAVSFVHGYRDEEKVSIRDRLIPSIAFVDSELNSIKKILSLKYPRIPEDFNEKFIGCEFIGQKPMQSSTSFKRKPRFGVMGLCKGPDSSILAATWNGIYKLKTSENKIYPESFITNQFINDPHGIAYKDGLLYSVLTPLDALIIIDVKTGEIINKLRLTRDLEIKTLDLESEFDWRFISKQARGAVGNWHFNNVVLRDDKVWLTSRLTSSMVEVDVKNMKAVLRTFCWDTPVMIHDGEYIDNGPIIHTSVDGKILISGNPKLVKSNMPSMKESGFTSLMQRDFISRTIKLSEVFGKEINWCRGIAMNSEYFFTTIYGRYEQDVPYFSICRIKENSDSSITTKTIKIDYKILEDPENIRYMTGFSIILNPFI